MKTLIVKNIINELSEPGYENTPVIINMKSGASINAYSDDLTLDFDDNCLIVEDKSTKWLDVDSIEYIEIKH